MRSFCSDAVASTSAIQTLRKRHSSTARLFFFISSSDDYRSKASGRLLHSAICCIAAVASNSLRELVAASLRKQRHGLARIQLLAASAGSAGRITPPAAHRTVRKPLDLYGSSQPFPCHLAMTKRLGRLTLIPVPRLAKYIFFALSPPLRSTFITKASSLLRDDPPLACASVLSPFVVPTYKVFPWHHMQSSQVPYPSPD